MEEKKVLLQIYKDGENITTEVNVADSDDRDYFVSALPDVMQSNTKVLLMVAVALTMAKNEMTKETRGSLEEFLKRFKKDNLPS